MFFPIILGDPYYNNVSLLLPMEGANNSTEFVDYSPTPKVVTAYGDAQISTAQSKRGQGSGAFDGSGDYLEVAHSSDLSLGSGDFTQECWVRFTGYPTVNDTFYVFHLFGKMRLDGNQATQSYFLQIQGTVNSLTALAWRGYTNDSTTNEIKLSYSFSLNTWYHIAAVRWSNKMYFYVNGNVLNSGGTAFTATIQNNTHPLRVGRFYNTIYLYELKGYLQDLRITKDVARYTGNFTPPSQLLSYPNTKVYLASPTQQPSFTDVACRGL